MFEESILKHHIQRQIVQVLMFSEYARFTDLCPPRVDTNLFSYHLKLLLKQDYIAKTKLGYTLSHKGLLYVDRVSGAKMKPRTQPKIITMLVIQNNRGEVLLQQRSKQPYINTWTLPYGKIHIDDPSLLAAANRETKEKLDATPVNLDHAGDCYIRVNSNGVIESTTLAHVVRVELNGFDISDGLQWVAVDNMEQLKLAPAVLQIVATSLNRNQPFFEEYTVENMPVNDSLAS